MTPASHKYFVICPCGESETARTLVDARRIAKGILDQCTFDDRHVVDIFELKESIE